MFKTKYRIVRKYNYYKDEGYVPQVKYWWFPFYIDITNRYGNTVEVAQQLIKLHKGEINE
jgi:hypothetical protein